MSMQEISLLKDPYKFSISSQELKTLSSLFIRIQTTRPNDLRVFLATNTQRLQLKRGILLQDILKYIELQKHIKYLEELERKKPNSATKELDDFLNTLICKSTTKTVLVWG